MANTNMFKVGDIVEYHGNFGTIERNDKDFRKWRVRFKDGVKTIHYEKLDIAFLKGEDIDANR